MIAAPVLLDLEPTTGARAGLRDMPDQCNTRSFSLLDCACFISYALIVFIAGLAKVKRDVVRRTILIPAFVAAKDVAFVVFVVVDLARVAARSKTVAEVWQI
jgi:hypothetical protein